MSNLLVGIHGKKYSGKDTLGNYIWGRYGFYRLAFATPVKEACAAIFQVPLEWFHDTEKKEWVHPYWGITLRQMMQRVGTEAVRGEFGNDHWVRVMDVHVQRTLPNDPVVITDVRQDHEAEYVLSKGGIVIEVVRSNLVMEDKHSSETGIRQDLISYTFNNHSGKEALFAQADEVLAPLLKG